MKIKIYSYIHEDKVSEMVNQFVNDHPDLIVKDFKFTTTVDNDEVLYSVMIIYDEVKK